MSKKFFAVPRVFLDDTTNPPPGAFSEPGGGDLDSLRPVPMSFGEWTQSRFVADYDSNPGVDFDDYANWFAQSGFGEDTWTVLNPGATMTGETK